MSYEGFIEVASLTDVGLVRSHNEDAVMVDLAEGFTILADGMGGYSAGEVASGIAVTMMAESLRAGLRKANGVPVAETLKRETERANGAIFQTAQSQPKFAGMGTTLVAAAFDGRKIVVVHVGDSRCYRLRHEGLVQLTRDHSLLQEQIDSGMISKENARHSANKNLVTRALGVDPEVEVDVQEFDVEVGDVYLLCSDGLSDMVEDEEMQLTLNIMAASNLPLAANQLVDMAKDNGGRDNISVALIRVVRELPFEHHWFSRVLGWFSK